MKDVGTAPKGCNGFRLVDENKDFSKQNFEWTQKSSGRPPLKKEKKISIRKTKFVNPKTVCIVLEQEYVDFIKNEALKRSMKEGKLIETNDLIRDALYKSFPTR